MLPSNNTAPETYVAQDMEPTLARRVTKSLPVSLAAGVVGTGLAAVVNPSAYPLRVEIVKHNGFATHISTLDFITHSIGIPAFRHIPSVQALLPHWAVVFSLVTVGFVAFFSRRKIRPVHPQATSPSVFDENPVPHEAELETQAPDTNDPFADAFPPPKMAEAAPVPEDMGEVEGLYIPPTPKVRRKYVPKNAGLTIAASHVVFKNVKPMLGGGASEAGREGAIQRFTKLVNTPIPLTLAEDAKLAALQAELDAKFPWFKDANAAVFKHLRMVAQLHDGVTPLAIKPILLNGPAGVGKTEWASKLAKMFGGAYMVATISGKNSMQDTGLKSTPRAYVGAGPSSLITAIVDNNTANPIVVLDELEKATPDIQNALLQFLEPSSAINIQDEFLEGALDLSKVQYLATTNSTTPLSEPMRTRFQIVEVREPAPEDADVVLEGMLARLCREWSITYDTLQEKFPKVDCLDLVGGLLEEKKSLREIYRAVLDEYSSAAEHSA